MSAPSDPQARARQMINEGAINPERTIAAPRPRRATTESSDAEPGVEADVTATAPREIAAPQSIHEVRGAAAKRELARHPTTANVPADLLHAVRRELAAARIDGARTTLHEVVNDEVQRLPAMGEALLAEVDRYAGQLNMGVPPSDPAHRQTDRLAIRLTDRARTQLERGVYNLEYQHDTPIDRQDLVALALARWLDTRTGSRRPTTPRSLN